MKQASANILIEARNANVNFGTFILEDDIEMHEVMKDILKSHGLEETKYEITGDPDIFLAKIKDSDFNLCILDHLLPHGYTGIDIIKEIKRKNKWSYVIVMSGQTSKLIAIKYLNEGANKYIDKTWSEKELKEVLGIEDDYQPTYLDVLVKYLKEAFIEARERIRIIKMFEKQLT
jgi:FixJ family two-component response regulator